MNYKDWCENSKSILKEAEKWNKFRKSVKNVLLSNIGPRIAQLGNVMYMGSGFHYSMEQSFGKLIAVLSMPWQPCANHCEKIEDDIQRNMMSKIIYEGLLKQVIRAEKSAKEFQTKHP